MQITMTLSAYINCSPFDIFDREIDEVITIIKYYLKLGAISTNANNFNNKVINHNDGFWDM